MSESSATSFPGFGSGLVTGSGEIVQSTTTQAHTEHGDISAGQVSPATSRGDSQPDQSSLIREIISDELRRALGCRSLRLEREGSSSSSSEDTRLSHVIPLGAILVHLCAPAIVHPLVGTHIAVTFHASVPHGPSGACLVQVHSLGYRQSSGSFSASYVHYACRSAASPVCFAVRSWPPIYWK